MKWNGFNKNDALLFIEFAAVFAFLLVPPLFSAVPFTLPPKPAGLYTQCVFCFYTVCAAAYEEILYRLYTPNRLHRIYNDYIKPRLQKNPPAAKCCSENAVDLPQSSGAHQQCRYKNPLHFTLLQLLSCSSPNFPPSSSSHWRTVTSDFLPCSSLPEQA